jgi:hypothetical protein
MNREEDKIEEKPKSQQQGTRTRRNRNSQNKTRKQGRPQQGRPQQGRPKQGRPQQGRPQSRQSQQGRPQSRQSQQGRPQSRQSQQGRPQQGRPQSRQSQQGRPQQGRPQSRQSQQGRPQQGRPQSNQPIQGRPQSRQSQQGRPRPQSRQSQQSISQKPQSRQSQQGRPRPQRPQSRPQQQKPNNQQLAEIYLRGKEELMQKFYQDRDVNFVRGDRERFFKYVGDDKQFTREELLELIKQDLDNRDREREALEKEIKYFFDKNQYNKSIYDYNRKMSLERQNQLINRQVFEWFKRNPGKRLLRENINEVFPGIQYNSIREIFIQRIPDEGLLGWTLEQIKRTRQIEEGFEPETNASNEQYYDELLFPGLKIPKKPRYEGQPLMFLPAHTIEPAPIYLSPEEERERESMEFITRIMSNDYRIDTTQPNIYRPNNQHEILSSADSDDEKTIGSITPKYRDEHWRLRTRNRTPYDPKNPRKLKIWAPLSRRAIEPLRAEGTPTPGLFGGITPPLMTPESPKQNKGNIPRKGKPIKRTPSTSPGNEAPIMSFAKAMELREGIPPSPRQTPPYGGETPTGLTPLSGVTPPLGNTPLSGNTPTRTPDKTPQTPHTPLYGNTPPNAGVTPPYGNTPPNAGVTPPYGNTPPQREEEGRTTPLYGAPTLEEQGYDKYGFSVYVDVPGPDAGAGAGPEEYVKRRLTDREIFNKRVERLKDIYRLTLRNTRNYQRLPYGRRNQEIARIEEEEERQIQEALPEIYSHAREGLDLSK